MAGDLEDFLKRAAERRAQKQQQAGGGAGRGAGARPTPTPKPAARPRPEYTEAKRERQIRQPIEDAIPIAEIVEVDHLAEKRQRLAEAKQKAEEARSRMAQQQLDIHQPKAADRGVISIAGGSIIDQLLDLLQRPGGIEQAMVLREILDRPEDRWK